MTQILIQYIITFGYIALFLAIFLESGVVIGFFLPGDSLLFTAGLLAEQGHFNIWLICLICFIAATLGVQAGYWFGNAVGREIFERDTFFFRKKYIKRAHEFYEQYGKMTIILGRFMPAIRTFVPIVAGIAKMDYRDFVLYNIVGAIIWAIGIPFAGFYLGKIVPNIDKYLLPVVIVVAVVSFIPPAFHLWRNRHTFGKDEE